jgi:hypothetical protein
MNSQMVSGSVLIAVSLVWLSDGVKAQTPQPAEPEYVGTVFWLSSSEGKLAHLEHQSPSSHIKVKALGYGGGRMVLSVKGGRSPVRLTADQQVFVVRLETNGLDPALLVGLDVLKATKKTREATVASVGPMGFGGAKSTARGETSLVLIFEKYGEHSFKVRPASALSPGEYVLRTKATENLGYLFGVD